VRERYSRWPFRDGLTTLAVDLWESYDKRRKHDLAIEMLQPLVDSGYLARRERARGQLAYYLARSYRRSKKGAMTRATLIHAAYHHPLSWYGIVALDELRTLDPFLAEATESTIPAPPKAKPDAPDWGESTALTALRDRLVVLSSYGLVEAVLTEAGAAGVVRHTGRAAWVGRLLLEMGAPREASAWAHEALDAHGVHSPLDGLSALWHIAYPRPFRRTVERHAETHDIDPRLAWAVMRIESRYGTSARSSAGAGGLLQVMPSTAKWLATMRMEPTDAIDLYDPARNIELGVDLLGRLRDRFEGDVPVMLVAYNAGSGRTQRWQRKVRAQSLARWVDRLPIAQAKNYVRSVVSAWALYRYLDGQSTALAPPERAAKTLAQNR
jgi:soluble lytic murein transglycosylase